MGRPDDDNPAKNGFEAGSFYHTPADRRESEGRPMGRKAPRMVAAFPASAEAPAPSFPPVPTPSSRDEADTIVLELSRLDAIEARNKADCDRAVATQKALYSARNKTVVDDVEWAIADRRSSLERALESFADANRTELLEGKGKSVKCNHGVYGWRKKPDRLEPVDDQTKAGRASLLDKLYAFCVEMLITFEGLSTAALQCVNPQITWDHKALLSAREKKRIDGDELRKIGFRVVEGEDEFYVKPSAVHLSSQSTAP